MWWICGDRINCGCLGSPAVQGAPEMLPLVGQLQARKTGPLSTRRQLMQPRTGDQSVACREVVILCTLNGQRPRRGKGGILSGNPRVMDDDVDNEYNGLHQHRVVYGLKLTVAPHQLAGETTDGHDQLPLNARVLILIGLYSRLLTSL